MRLSGHILGRFRQQLPAGALSLAMSWPCSCRGYSDNGSYFDLPLATTRTSAQKMEMGLDREEDEDDDMLGELKKEKKTKKTRRRKVEENA